MSKLYLGTPVSEYTPPAHEWLVDYRFPLKRCVLFGGLEKGGKSLFVSLLAAAVTNPEVELAPGVRANETGNVVIFSTERTDDYFARVEVAGANIAMVRIVNAERGYDFDDVLRDIENIKPESEIRLIVLDHIGDLSDKEIRSVAKVGNIINGLTTQAMRLRCCILLVTHTIKNATKANRFQQTFGGSVAWARKVSDLLALCAIKQGVGVVEHGIGTKKRFESRWEFRITSKVSSLKDDKGDHIESEFMTIEGDSPVSYLEAFNMSAATAQGHVSKLDMTKNLLQRVLADGELPAKDIFELAKQNDISERTVWSAAKALGIVTSGGPGSKWTLLNSAKSATGQTNTPLQGLQSSVVARPDAAPRTDLIRTTPTKPIVPAKRVSLFRYPGGKHKQAPHYASLIGNCETIFEPFVGGGHVTLFALLNGVAKRARINDIDPGVAAFWQVLFEGSDADFEALKKLIDRTPTIEEFRRLREEEKRDDHSIVQRAFHAFFFNKTTHSGIITAGPMTRIDCRYNAARFLVEMDRVRVFKGKVDVTCGDFASCIAEAERGDFIYCDPPYVKAGDMLYTKAHQRMAVTGHERLEAALTDADYRGVPFLCSYDDDRKIFADYDGFNVYDRLMLYTIDGKKTANKTANELLIANFQFAESVLVKPEAGVKIDAPQPTSEPADIDNTWPALVMD